MWHTNCFAVTSRSLYSTAKESESYKIVIKYTSRRSAAEGYLVLIKYFFSYRFVVCQTDRQLRLWMAADKQVRILPLPHTTGIHLVGVSRLIVSTQLYLLLSFSNQILLIFAVSVTIIATSLIPTILREFWSLKCQDLSLDPLLHCLIYLWTRCRKMTLW